MKSRFKIGIILMGVVLPLVAVALVLGLISSRKEKVEVEYAKRKSGFEASQRQAVAMQGLGVRLKQFDDRKGSWEELLQDSDIGKVTQELNDISSKFRGSGTFKQNGFDFVNQETGIGAASLQPSVSFRVSLSGTYQAIQQSLLILESRMPNLSLNSMTLTPRNNSPLLQAELSYSAWKK